MFQRLTPCRSPAPPGFSIDPSVVVDGGLQQLQKRFQHSRLGAQVGAVECPKHDEQHQGKTSSRTMTTESIVQDDILGLIDLGPCHRRSFQSCWLGSSLSR